MLDLRNNRRVPNPEIGVVDPALEDGPDLRAVGKGRGADQVFGNVAALRAPPGGREN